MNFDTREADPRYYSRDVTCPECGNRYLVDGRYPVPRHREVEYCPAEDQSREEWEQDNGQFGVGA